MFVPRYAVDAAGRADVSYDLTVRYPDGRTQAMAANEVAGKIKVRTGTILFPQTIRAFVTGPRDPFGEYRFEITVHDHVSGGSARQSVVLHVAESNRPVDLPEAFDASDWLSQYYLKPEPRLALPALEAISKNSALMQKGVDGLGTVLGFYGQVITDSPWLLPWFKQWYVAADEGNERRLLGLHPRRRGRHPAGRNADLPTWSWIVLAAAAKERFPRLGHARAGRPARRPVGPRRRLRTVRAGRSPGRRRRDLPALPGGDR